MYLGTHSTNLECLLLFAILSLSGLGINFSILLDTSAMIRAQCVESMTHLVVLVEILIILVKLINVLILVIVLVSQGFTGKVINGTWDNLLLEVLSELVVGLETCVELLELVLVNFVGFESFGCGWLRGFEKVKEGFGGNFLSDRSGLAGG